MKTNQGKKHHNYGNKSDNIQGRAKHIGYRP